jgi:hypothetical protein
MTKPNCKYCKEVVVEHFGDTCVECDGKGVSSVSNDEALTIITGKIPPKTVYEAKVIMPINTGIYGLDRIINHLNQK